jgi:hypothetical protein
MLAKLQPLYFQSAEDADFVAQMAALKSLLEGEAELLPPRQLGEALPEGIDAVVFPQMLGDAYRHLPQFQALPVPLLVITSEFGTVSMWDWEINRYLRAGGVQVIAPYNLEQARRVCRLLALKRELRHSRFVVYQDNPGDGFQASIFKRFYWWEAECSARLSERFGVQVEKRSFRELGQAAKAIPDAQAEQAWKEWQAQVPVEGVDARPVLSAVKLYLALKRELDAEPGVLGSGINCLNESHFSDTTPCLAWDMFYAERGLIWGCEADTVSMMTETLAIRGLGLPAMMTNLYPYLMGQAALKHENIPDFPPVAEPKENTILAAHCGYLGVVPRAFASQWALKRKVLAIVNDNATAIDARLPEGKMTLLKLDSSLGVLSVVEGELEGYAGFAGSDCRNGALLRVPDGHHLMQGLASHHYVLAHGQDRAGVDLLGAVFGLDVQRIQ